MARCYEGIEEVIHRGLLGKNIINGVLTLTLINIKRRKEK
jgi:hypothetical protein